MRAMFSSNREFVDIFPLYFSFSSRPIDPTSSGATWLVLTVMP
jgi:hypothetical protein